MTLAPPEKPRRFYKTVTVEPVDGRFAVRLDGRGARAPGGALLTAPTEALARLLAEEWDAQRESIDTAAMPATRLAFTALDRTPTARDGIVGEVVRYAGSDLLCYLEEETRSLAEREAKAWGPWLSWADEVLGVKLRPSFGISPTAQDPGALERVSEHAGALHDFALTGLVFACGLYGSAVLAFAVQRGALAAEDAFELSRLDEAYQEEQWGVDEEARARTEARRQDARMIGRWFAALL